MDTALPSGSDYSFSHVGCSQVCTRLTLGTPRILYLDTTDKRSFAWRSAQPCPEPFSPISVVLVHYTHELEDYSIGFLLLPLLLAYTVVNRNTINKKKKKNDESMLVED